MPKSLRTAWQKMKRGHPGRRFQDRYAAAKKSRDDAAWAKRAFRVFRLLVALGAIVIGLFLTVLPGPAILFFFIAGSLVATESLFVARALDWSELRLRALADWTRRRWQRLPGADKFALGGAASFLAVILAYAACRVLL